MTETAPAGDPAARTADRPRVGRQVRIPKTAELISRSLRRQIIRGQLQPGDPLPPETSLMEQFGVSRPTLREAFRVLESEGLITIRRGAHGGARVAAPDIDVAARYAGLILEHRGATLADVYRAAAVIEPACARKLALKHTAADIARLRAAIDAEKAAKDRPMALVQAQDDFHALLVELAGNHTLILLGGILRYIVDRANSSYLAADPESSARRSNARKAHRTHVKLVDLIEAGNAEEAEDLWERHVTAADDAVNAVGAKTVLDLLD
ncbi:FadR/GntR family transcriptional regulator [Actinomadura sp. SCN-SB]|uniref:FadR/GntR family transcriptional regulator n=1 Tax=Actinomadura sp. SCN-SB TaxID=3373092 RepID=UPI003752F158